MIIIDANNLAYIAFYAMGELSNEDMRTGTIFGFLLKILSLSNQFGKNFVFCWDSKKSLRKTIYREYKANRQQRVLRPDLETELREAYKQMHILRCTILPELGFKNNFMRAGFEADDLIASLCEKGIEKKVVVSSDDDLLQLLRSHIRIHNPRTKKTITEKDFKKRFDGLEPYLWANVKAMAGCTSDNIKGIKGIGEKYAVKYFIGKLDPKSKAYSTIDGNLEEYKKCLRLTRLPLKLETIKPLRLNVKKNDFKKSEFIRIFDKLRFIHFLKEEQFSKWEKNFNL